MRRFPRSTRASCATDPTPALGTIPAYSAVRFEQRRVGGASRSRLLAEAGARGFLDAAQRHAVELQTLETVMHDRDQNADGLMRLAYRGPQLGISVGDDVHALSTLTQPRLLARGLRADLRLGSLGLGIFHIEPPANPLFTQSRTGAWIEGRPAPAWRLRTQFLEHTTGGVAIKGDSTAGLNAPRGRIWRPFFPLTVRTTMSTPNTHPCMPVSVVGSAATARQTGLPGDHPAHHAPLTEFTLRPLGSLKRLVIVEDEPTMREALIAVLCADPEYEIAGEFTDGRSAFEGCVRLRPDIVVTDLGLPGLSGIELIDGLNRAGVEAGIMVFSANTTRDMIRRAMEAGIRGYVAKLDGLFELNRGLAIAAAGGVHFSPSIVRALRSSHTPLSPMAATTLLTEREKEILRLLAHGFSARQTAAVLSIQTKTVENHRANLMRKLDLRSAVSLARFAYQAGLADLNSRPQPARPCPATRDIAAMPGITTG